MKGGKLPEFYSVITMYNDFTYFGSLRVHQGQRRYRTSYGEALKKL